jgi:hypothetical protein
LAVVEEGTALAIGSVTSLLGETEAFVVESDCTEQPNVYRLQEIGWGPTGRQPPGSHALYSRRRS